MDIGIIGGTGDLGMGLAVRLSDAGHSVYIGSRDEERGIDAAERYSEHTSGKIDGGANQGVGRCSVVVLSVPYRYATDTVENLREEIDGSVLVSPVVPMSREEQGFIYEKPDAGSAAQEIKNAVGDMDVSVTGGFHNVAAKRLADLDRELGIDVVVFGDGEAREVLLGLIDDMDGMRGLDAGGFGLGDVIEGVTPLLIEIGRRNDMHDLGIQFK